MRKLFTKVGMATFALGMLLTMAQPAQAVPKREKLDRALTAFKAIGGNFLSWRYLDDDPADLKFEVYRDGELVQTLDNKTNWKDVVGKDDSKYVVKCVSSNLDQIDPVARETPETSVITDPYLRVKLNYPPRCPRTNAYYTPNDCSVGDVDGDGQYEIFVKWDPSNSQDNSISGKTGNVLIDCYKLDGTFLWRVDLGQNIRAGAHYTQFMVYDFDGDGKAEMMCKTAPGTKDSKGKNVLLGSDDPSKNYYNSDGHVIQGPEYLTVFNGLTGEEIHTISYNPPRTIQPQTKDGWGDSYGGRSERYLACVAYLGGTGHSAVFCRGYYTYAYLWAVDFDGKELKERWLYSSPKGKELYGEGAHSLTVGDVDGDGYDEIIYGAAALDHDGKFLHRTGAAHGDALHMGDFDPDHEGLEVFMVHEEKGSSFKYDATFRDAKTGEMLWFIPQSGNDIGRGMCADISATYRGHECWPGSYYGTGAKGNATFDCKGNLIVEKRGSTNFRIYWDGDPQDELFDGCYDSTSNNSSPEVIKRNAAMTSTSGTWSFNTYNAQSCNTTKGTPCLQADILGDWREELILWDGNNKSDLLIFQTTASSNYMVPCLMTDHQYRMAVAWQNVAYNQPPHLSYNLAVACDRTPNLSFSKGSTNMTVELGTSITIEGKCVNCTGVSCHDLPEGLTLNVNDAEKTFTITGTIAAEGSYTFNLNCIGGSPATTIAVKVNVIKPVNLTEVAHYSFEEFAEYVTNHVNGSAQVVGAPTSTDGIYGNAIHFNGSTDRISQDAYDDIQMGENDFTIEFWMRSKDDAAYLLHKGSIARNAETGTTGNWIGIELKKGNLTFAIDDDVNKSQTSTSAEGYFNNEWVHVVCVRDHAAKQLKLYLNGVLQGTGEDKTGALADNNEPLTLGNVNVNFDAPYEGDFDDFHIYLGAMPASRVLERYKAAFPDAVEELADEMQPKNLKLYDAQTGLLVAEGVGEPENVLSGLEENAGKVYILVTVQGRSRKMEKIIR